MTSQLTVTLRAALPTPIACKICDAPAPLFDVVDFHKSCREATGEYFDRVGVPVYYRRCEQCGFLFTDAFDDWDRTAFATFIYNAEYVRVDPDFGGERARHNAAFLSRLFETDRAALSVLDWGGGDGLLAAGLLERGFRSAITYDPFVDAHAAPPAGRFDVVTCFETLEHLHHPRAGVAALAERVSTPGVVVFLTLLQPSNILETRLGWWYAAPRNGHVSLYSRHSLVLAWQRHGFTLASFDDDTHVAFRERPAFLRV